MSGFQVIKPVGLTEGTPEIAVTEAEIQAMWAVDSAIARSPYDWRHRDPRPQTLDELWLRIAAWNGHPRTQLSHVQEILRSAREIVRPAEEKAEERKRVDAILQSLTPEQWEELTRPMQWLGG